jgi:hypothetical protein
MYAIFLFCFGVSAYLFGVALIVPRYFLDLNTELAPINEWIVWYSRVPVKLGVGACIGRRAGLLSHGRPGEPLRLIVANNNSTDNTISAALVAGAPSDWNPVQLAAASRPTRRQSGLRNGKLNDE